MPEPVPALLAAPDGRAPPAGTARSADVPDAMPLLDELEVAVADTVRLVDRFAHARHAVGAAGDVGFADLVRGAAMAHPSLRAPVLATRQARQAVGEERGRLFPQVSTGFGVDRRFTDVQGPTVSNGLNPSASLSVSQLLFDFGTTFGRIDSAVARAAGRRFQSLARVTDFTLGAVSAYYDVHRLRTLVDLAQDNWYRHARLLEEVTRRAEGGVGSAADTARAAGRLAEAESQLIDYTGQHTAAVATYREVFGAAPEHDRLPPLAPFVMPPDVALRALERSNPQILAAEAEARAAALDARAEDLSRWPSVALEVVGRRYLHEDPQVGQSDVTVGVRTSVPLYSGGSNDARRRRAVLREAELAEEARALRLALEREIHRAFAESASRRQSIVAQTHALEADRQTLTAYLEMFIIGKRTLTDLLDVQRELFNTSIAVVQARVGADIAQYRLLSLTGELLERFQLGDLVDD